MLSYQTIFSRVLNEIDDLKELSLDKNDLFDIYTERLHSVVGNPRVRKLFSSLSLDDEIQAIIFSLKNPIDNESDEYFVLNILTLGIAIEWLKPHVNSNKYTSLVFGGKEEKKLLDNYKNVTQRLSNMQTELKKLICDYGYINNSYLH